MHTENVVYIQGPQERIFELACAIDEWPRILPHYREVRVTKQTEGGRRKAAFMHAVRDGFPLPGVHFPVRWRCVQVCEPDAGRIYFKHIGGLARGMWVVWTLAPDAWGRGVRVSIRHELTYPFAFLNGAFARELVGNVFVGFIAGQTLATLKEIVERAG